MDFGRHAGIQSKQSCRGYGPSSRVHRWRHGVVLWFGIPTFPIPEPKPLSHSSKKAIANVPFRTQLPSLSHAEAFRTQPFPLLGAQFEFPQIPAGCTNVSTVPKKPRWERQSYCCCTDSLRYVTSSRKPEQVLKYYASPFSFSTLNK